MMTQDIARARVFCIMPVRNEARDLPDTLASLEAQTFDRSRLYITLIDGFSEDATREIAEAWFARTGIAGTILQNPARTIPSSLNRGIDHARPDDIIVRLDGHTRYAPEYLGALIATLENAPDDVACVGGPQHPVSDDAFEHRLVGTLYSNPMGLGGADHRSGTGTKYVTQVYLGAWRPGILQQIGGFDERFRANEDSEISARILMLGKRILWGPFECSYKVNRGVKKTVAQWGGYGFWRAQTLRRYPKLAKPRHFVAPAGMICGAALLISPARIVLVPAIAAYAALVVAKRAPGDGVGLALAGVPFFAACQAAWSLGLLRGLFQPSIPFTSTLASSDADLRLPAASHSG